MKKTLLAMAALAATASAQADVLLCDSFAYPAGALNSRGQWVVNGSQGSYPVSVSDQSLTRTGYQDAPAGNAVTLTMELGSDSNQAIFAPKGTPAPTAIYYSALVRIDEMPSVSVKAGGFLCLTGTSGVTGDFGDGISSSEGGALCVRKGSDENSVRIGVSVKNSLNGLADTDVAWADTEIPLGETVLAVMRYEQTDGDSNDTVSLFLNPGADTTEPDAVSTGIGETLTDLRAVALNQRARPTSKTPRVTVDEIRVATTMAEIFSGQSAPVTVPNITVEGNPLDFGQVYTGVTVSRDVIVRGTDLTGDITVTPGESGQVTVSATSIAASAAMNADGFTLTLTLDPVESRFFSDRITLSSPGALDKVINGQWHPVPALVANTLRELADEDTHDMVSVYVYKGEATVTFIESYYDLSYDRVVNSIFAQDATGGVELRSATGCGYEEIDISGVSVGDNLTDIAGYLIFGDNGLTMVPRTAADWRVTSHGNQVTPIDLTLRQMAMAEDGYTYGNQLVRVCDMRFLDDYYWAGDYHGKWNSQKYQIFDGTLDDYEGLAWMWCNQAADYYKTSTEGYFNHRWNMTGICKNYYPLHISPRGKSDFEDLGERDMVSLEATGADSADAPAVYYNIQGVRVDNPVGGLYICRRGTTATKVLLP